MEEQFKAVWARPLMKEQCEQCCRRNLRRSTRFTIQFKESEMLKPVPHFMLFAMAMIVAMLAGDSTVSAQERSKKEMQELYMTYLKREGYVPSVDSDGDVVFKIEGKSYFIAVHEDDPEFFRLVHPNFWEIENLAERQEVILACQHANSKTKCTKVVMVRDNVWASVEIFVEKPEDFEKVFKRCLSALRVGVSNFVDKMREE